MTQDDFREIILSSFDKSKRGCEVVLIYNEQFFGKDRVKNT